MRFVYPDGKKKALTFSYDDGQIHDRRLVEILNRYGMKGTFHLNSGKLAQDRNNDVFVAADEWRSCTQGMSGSSWCAASQSAYSDKKSGGK